MRAGRVPVPEGGCEGQQGPEEAADGIGGDQGQHGCAGQDGKAAGEVKYRERLTLTVL